MKTIFFPIIILALALVSCEKKQPTPQQPSSNVLADINVEYRITNESADVTIEYLAPEQGLQGLQTKTESCNKTYKVISFTTKENELLSIKAWNNTNPWYAITVDIYVNGKLFKTASTNPATISAHASGVFAQ